MIFCQTSQNLLFAHLEMTKVAKSENHKSFIPTNQSKSRSGLMNEIFDPTPKKMSSSLFIAVHHRTKLQGDPDWREFGHQGIWNCHARSQLQKLDRFSHFEATGGRSAPQNEGEMVNKPQIKCQTNLVYIH